MTGQSEFDHVKFPYFYRLVPPDLSESYAMIGSPTTCATTSGSRSRSATTSARRRSSQPAIAAIKTAGETLVANETLDLNATTFRTEAAKIVAAKPDVILTEALGPPEAAFLSEVKQLNGGKLSPVIGTSATISPDWFKSVSAAVGASTLASNFWADNLVTETSGPAFQAFSTAMYAEKGKVGSTGDFSTYLTAPGAVHLYDGINLAALAMIESQEHHPTVFKADIEKIGDGVPGATVVYSFAQGAAALKAGQADPLRGTRRADELRRLPRLDRALPGRHATARQGQVNVDRRTSRLARLRALGLVSRNPPRGPATSRASAADVSIFVESIGFGLVTAAVLALAAVGFTLQFAVTERAQPRLRRRDDRRRLRGLRDQPGRGERLDQRARGDRRGRAALAVPEQRRLHARSSGAAPRRSRW